jgi:uncharacterized protein (TIGR03067 family)
MRKTLDLSLVFCVALGLSLGARPAAVRADDGDNKPDIDRLQGHWRVVSSQVGDEQALEAEFKNRRLTFAGDKLTYEYGNEQQEKREGTIKLDPKTGAFDWTVPLEGGTSLAIYKIKGDTLKIGFGNDGLVRPKRWEISQENVVWLLVLKREIQDAPLPAPVKKLGAIFRVSDSATLDVALSADGKLLARGGADTTVDLWEVASGKRLHTLKGHIVPILKVAFSPDGKTLASVSCTAGIDNDKDTGKLPLGALKLWDVVTAKQRASSAIPVLPGFHFFSLAFTADGKTMISAMWSVRETENEIGLAVDHWDVATGKARAGFWAPSKGSENGAGSNNAGIYFAALSADGKTVAWGGTEEQDQKITGTAHVWEVQALAASPPRLPAGSSD